MFQLVKNWYLSATGKDRHEFDIVKENDSINHIPFDNNLLSGRYRCIHESKQCAVDSISAGVLKILEELLRSSDKGYDAHKSGRISERTYAYVSSLDDNERAKFYNLIMSIEQRFDDRDHRTLEQNLSAFNARKSRFGRDPDDAIDSMMFSVEKNFTEYESLPTRDIKNGKYWCHHYDLSITGRMHRDHKYYNKLKYTLLGTEAITDTRIHELMDSFDKEERDKLITLMKLIDGTYIDPESVPEAEEQRKPHSLLEQLADVRAPTLPSPYALASAWWKKKTNQTPEATAAPTAAPTANPFGEPESGAGNNETTFYVAEEDVETAQENEQWINPFE